MGYTHYWRRPQVIDADTYAAITRDVGKVLQLCQDQGIPLGDAYGEGQPDITSKTLGFNGLKQCGHPHQDLGIVWPADHARGATLSDNPAGTWFGGALVASRVCGGDCSHESFCFDQTANDSFAFCKTAFKPYDIAVTAALIVIKHYLPAVVVTSDGDDEKWADGRLVCMMACGYGEEFRLD
ncbi:hypothetical protein [Sulfobacillus sp. hq2]|uniref:hypothetical protein n=1 Tax=Sulfobacillus sp. hq2 TaxID=2039167 RepID=UPI000CD1D4FF|nr:hypothetical protein [Sulfobacillus sp. hq2]POB12323.1 hypothetical protein CO251_00200 [Sulfobacillus sp. hq2]